LIFLVARNEQYVVKIFNNTFFICDIVSVGGMTSESIDSGNRGGNEGGGLLLFFPPVFFSGDFTPSRN
jgi:hypothetical protein